MTYYYLSLINILVIYTVAISVGPLIIKLLISMGDPNIY